MTTFTRRCLVALLITAAAAVLAGCGDKKGVSAPKAPAKPKPASEPKADAALTKDVGTALKPLTDAGCAYGVFTEEEAVHVDDPADLEWKSFPPASGTHFGQWANFGWYDKPVNDGYFVHNLEHGGVAMWLGTDVTDPQSAALEGLLDDGEKWVAAPRKDLEGLAVNAWAKSLSCSPDALAKLEPAALATAVDAWYDAVESQGSEAEKDLPPYGGGLSDPKPSKDISVDAPF